MISKLKVGLKFLLHQGLSEPEIYGFLVYKFKEIVGRTNFYDQFRKMITLHKRIGYDLNVMRQSACLVINPITVYSFAPLSNLNRTKNINKHKVKRQRNPDMKRAAENQNRTSALERLFYSVGTLVYASQYLIFLHVLALSPLNIDNRLFNHI